MPSIKIILILGLTFLFASGCQTMSKEDCKSGNWTMQGYKDALKGRPENHIDKQVKACSGFGVKVNQEEYTEGYESGLRKFCTFKEGYIFGKDGGEYKNSCPEELEPEFYKGYVEGKKSLNLEKLEDD